MLYCYDGLPICEVALALYFEIVILLNYYEGLASGVNSC